MPSAKPPKATRKRKSGADNGTGGQLDSDSTEFKLFRQELWIPCCQALLCCCKATRHSALCRAAFAQTLLQLGCVPEEEAKRKWRRISGQNTGALDVCHRAAGCRQALPPGKLCSGAVALQTPDTETPSHRPSRPCSSSTWTSSACATRWVGTVLLHPVLVWTSRCLMAVLAGRQAGLCGSRQSGAA